MIDMKYLVVSAENLCVYTYSPRPVTAHAISAGIADSMVFGLTEMNSPHFNKFANRNFFHNKVWVLVLSPTGITLKERNQSEVTEDWVKNREIARARQNAFAIWETHTEHALARTNRRSWEPFTLIATQQLDMCKPEEGYYTKCIEEYAKVMMKPVDHVYKELKLQIDSDTNVKFRIQALADKWKDKINECDTQEQINKAKEYMLREFWTNSYLS